LKDAGNTFKGLDGPISTGYAVLTASLLAAGLGYIFAPALTLQGVSWSHLHALALTAAVAWHGMAWHGMAWHGMAWHGMAWHGMAWHGMAWHAVAVILVGLLR
jgi:hypothetical protein